MRRALIGLLIGVAIGFATQLPADGIVNLPGSGGLSTGTANATYLRLDTTNDPLTGTLTITGFETPNSASLKLSGNITGGASTEGCEDDDDALCLLHGGSVIVGDGQGLFTYWNNGNQTIEVVGGVLEARGGFENFGAQTNLGIQFGACVNPGDCQWDNRMDILNGDAIGPQITCVLQTSVCIADAQGMSFDAVILTGTNAIHFDTNGQRLDLGTGANDYLFSDGTNVETGGALDVSGALSVGGPISSTAGAVEVDDAQGLDVSAGNLAVGGGQITVTGTAPTLSACGTTPAVEGSNSVGMVTIGTGVTTSCTVTFATAFPNAPTCLITGPSTSITYAATATTAALTILSSADMDSEVINYLCFGL